MHTPPLPSALFPQHSALLRALTRTETSLLACLQSAQGHPVPTLSLAHTLWPHKRGDHIAESDDACIRTHIKNVRRKLARHLPDARIQTERGGYSYHGPAIHLYGQESVPAPAPTDDYIIRVPRHWAPRAIRFQLYTIAPHGLTDIINYTIVNGQPVPATHSQETRS